MLLLEDVPDFPKHQCTQEKIALRFSNSSESADSLRTIFQDTI